MVARGIVMCGIVRAGAGEAAVVSAPSARACAFRVGAAKSKTRDETAKIPGVRMVAPLETRYAGEFMLPRRW
jgi:hypothetical protein